MRTGADGCVLDEYEGGTLAGIECYFSTFEEPFIKGLLRDKGGQELLLKIEDKQNEILIFMQQLMDDYNRTFQGVPIYLYMKREHRRGEPKRVKAFTLLWRISRSICGTDDNTMITHLFSEDSKYNYVLNKFGPGMRQKLRDYDKYRLSLNMAENLLRYQKRSISSYHQATSLNG